MSLKVRLSELMMNTLRREAKKLEITPNVLARIRLCQIYGSTQSDDFKSHIVDLKNWREIEAYVETKGYGNISIFLQKTAEWYMKKYHLSEAQKEAVEKSIEKPKEIPAYASAGPL